jgi:hypothetical protein
VCPTLEVTSTTSKSPETVTGEDRVVTVPSPTCPFWFCPQHATVPFARTAQVVNPVAIREAPPQLPAMQPVVQVFPQRPQWVFELKRLVSQPLIALPSQSPKPALHAPMPHAPLAQVPVALAGARPSVKARAVLAPNSALAPG